MHGPEGIIELFHGYTYSGHPVAAAAALATLDIYARDGLLTRIRELEIYWQEGLHSLKGLPHVIDIRNTGMVGAVHLASRDGAPGKRGYDVFEACFWAGLMVRNSGDIIAMAPPLIVEKSHIDQIINTLGDVIRRTA
jgi:beta-alanine--pyruvate transaminase